MHATATDLIELLTQHKTLGSAPREELAWLAEHGSVRRLETGDVVSHKGQPVEGMFVILSGRLALFVDRGAGPNKLVEWGAGDVTGLLPFSRLVSPPGDSIVQESMEFLVLPKEQLREMIRECFEMTSILVHRMLDRTRMFTSSELQDEKMISLGKLSAGLAHELNNPASAINRNACVLADRVRELETAARALIAAGLSEAQMAAVEEVRESCLVKGESGPRTAMDQVDREDEIAGWLADRGLDGTSAGMLADSGVSFEALNALAGKLQGPTLDAALRWAVLGCSLRGMAGEIQGASSRISSLVTAVKGFTHMDQAMALERVDLSTGLNDTVTVLRAKASLKTVSVTMEVEAGLPKVSAFAAELNQIWGVLLENALDAAPMGGCVEVRARREGPQVVVRFLDDGHGIAEEIRSRVFDPFFTTKPQGQGTGLGLDIARRLARHNEGGIDFESQPGRTEFRVSLPVAG